jgi:hypothetical protein
MPANFNHVAFLVPLPAQACEVMVCRACAKPTMRGRNTHIGLGADFCGSYALRAIAYFAVDMAHGLLRSSFGANSDFVEKFCKSS